VAQSSLVQKSYEEIRARAKNPSSLEMNAQVQVALNSSSSSKVGYTKV
jgi:hypothetical protein